MNKDELLLKYKADAFKYLDKFKLTYQLRSFPKILSGPEHGSAIIYSEAYAFISLCEFFKVNRIMESGVCNGGSTRMLYSYFKDVSNVSIKSIEQNPIRPDLIQELDDRIVFVEGNSMQIIPKFLKLDQRDSDARVGIMIDGPKYDSAIELANKCFKYKCVEFVLIHDMCKRNDEKFKGELNPSRLKMEKMPNAFFFTDEDWYVGAFSHLDTNKDFVTRYDKFGSYSFTFGCLVNPKYI